MNAVPNTIIVYLHGGVYALGSVRSHGALVSHIAQKLRTTLVFVDYALAPEHPYPSANNDVMAVYTALLRAYPDYKIGLIGDSAGGGLSVSLVSDLQREELPLPYAVAMAGAPIEKVNPAQKPLSSFPPVLITVGTNEVLADDSANFYETLKHLQPSSTFTIYENQYHVWPLADINSESSLRLLAQMEGFFNSAASILQSSKPAQAIS